jgi:peptide/nickel transport system substrate-binding protein
MKLTRREFIRVSGLTAAASLAVACAQLAPAAPTAAPAAPTTAPAAVPTIHPSAGAAPTAPPPVEPVAKYNEAPMLADLVAKGELPPVDERLPENPVVWPVFESIGKYGGTMRRSHSGVSDANGPLKLTRRRLNWYNPDLTVRPDLAEGWEINEDATVWTYHLRKGGKWSDGTPFTSQDFAYWWVDTQLNKDLTPAVSTDWKSGGEVMDLQTPDDFTVVFKFTAPLPLFHYTMGNRTPFAPAEYMKQFHPSYTDKAALDAQAKAAGFETWVQYYADQDTFFMNPARPAVDTWLAKNKLSEELFVMERNPYFMGVDPEGNQLPYIDKVTHRLRANADVFAMWILNGEIDFQGRSIPDYTLMKEGEAKGNYTVVRGFGEGHSGLNPNHACKNPLVREFFQNRDCRIALSLALDREEINDLIYDGEWTPRQYSPTEGSPQYYPKASNVFLEYDPDQANELLDGAGYDQRDKDGYRMWKDGSGPVSFIIEGRSELPGDEILMWVKYFSDVGLKVSYNGVERSLYTEHYLANEVECGCWGGDRAHLPLVDATIFLGVQPDRPWSGAWGLWKIDPTDPNGEEPPEGHWIRDIWSIWDKVAVEPDEAKQNTLFFQILDIWAEQLPMVHVAGMDRRSVIVKNDMKNYGGLDKPFWGTMDDSGYAPTQYYVNPEEYVR